MAFLRTKKVNGNEYGYLVQNKHTKQGPRQKVKKYLGRAITFEPKENLNFFDYFKINNRENYFKKSRKEILQDLVKFELIRHGFQERNNILTNENISFNGNQILKGKKEVLLSLNEGFLCTFTLDRIFKFKKTGDFQKDALKLAKYFVEAGIKVPQEVFVRFYGK